MNSADGLFSRKAECAAIDGAYGARSLCVKELPFNERYKKSRSSSALTRKALSPCNMMRKGGGYMTKNERLRLVIFLVNVFGFDIVTAIVIVFMIENM